MRKIWYFGILLAAAETAVAQDMPLSQILPPGEGWQVALKDCKFAGALAGDCRGNVYVADPDGKQILCIDPDGKAAVLCQDGRRRQRPRRRRGRPGVTLGRGRRRNASSY